MCKVLRGSRLSSTSEHRASCLTMALICGGLCSLAFSWVFLHFINPQLEAAFRDKHAKESRSLDMGLAAASLVLFINAFLLQSGFLGDVSAAVLGTSPQSVSVDSNQCSYVEPFLASTSSSYGLCPASGHLGSDLSQERQMSLWLLPADTASLAISALMGLPVDPSVDRVGKAVYLLTHFSQLLVYCMAFRGALFFAAHVLLDSVVLCIGLRYKEWYSAHQHREMVMAAHRLARPLTVLLFAWSRWVSPVAQGRHCKEPWCSSACAAITSETLQ